jgi:hypothetical protein
MSNMANVHVQSPVTAPPVDRWGARSSYEWMLMQQPQILFDGLWQVGDDFFIVCPTLGEDPSARDGTPLTAWFASNRVIGAPVQLVPRAPAGAVKVPVRTLEQLVTGCGESHTLTERHQAFALALPKDFPDFRLSREDPRDLVLTSARVLTNEETQLLARVFAAMDSPLTLRTKVDFPLLASTRGEGDIHLVPSNLLGTNLGKDARWAWEADEDFWATNRIRMFHGEFSKASDLLPNSFKGSSSCVVDSIGARNLRTYLPIYKRVVLVAPVESLYERALARLRVSKDEILELMRLGRVQLLFPQSAERYPLTLFRRAVEEAPEAFLLSRRLGAACMIDARRRMLLHPPGGPEERGALLRELAIAAAKTPDGAIRRALNAALDQYGTTWSLGPSLLNRFGAMATLWSGIGPLTAATLHAIRGMDLRLEIVSAGMDVAWGGAIGATIFPKDDPEYSEQAAVELCASAYTGIANLPVPTNFGDVATVLDGLLGIDNDAPVVELARAFNPGDLDRMRKVTHAIAEPNLDPEFLSRAVAELNAGVRQYESRVAHQVRFDTMTAAGAIAGVAGTLVSGSLGAAVACVPLAGWLAARVLASNGAGAGGWRDLARALNALSSTDAVLVSRMRKQARKQSSPT